MILGRDLKLQLGVERGDVELHRQFLGDLGQADVEQMAGAIGDFDQAPRVRIGQVDHGQRAASPLDKSVAGGILAGLKTVEEPSGWMIRAVSSFVVTAGGSCGNMKLAQRSTPSSFAM